MPHSVTYDLGLHYLLRPICPSMLNVQTFKISYTKVCEKIAYVNSVDQDQTAPSGAV